MLRAKATKETGYEALARLWNALAAQMPLEPGPKNAFPDSKQLEEESRDYALLAFRREDALPDHDYAYVYFEHDVVGLVAFFQSPEAADFEALRKKLPPEANKVPALAQFVTLGLFTDRPVVPATLAPAAYDPTPFLTAQGFSLWSLKPEGSDLCRLLAAVPNAPEKQRAFQKALAGPEVNDCPFLLEYQIYSAKVRWLMGEFDRKYRQKGPNNLRDRWKTVEEGFHAALRSGAADPQTLSRQQQEEGGLTLMHRDLKQMLVTLHVAAGKLERLRPRARSGAALFDLCRRDQEQAERLREAVTTEMNYIEATLDGIKAMQSVYLARLEQQRLETEQQRQEQETEKNYRDLVQNSLVTGLLLGLGTIQASVEYHDPERRWPLVAFAGALGFALPVLALRLPETKKRAADHWAWAFLVGTFITLAYAFMKKWLPYPILPSPLLVEALALCVVFLRQSRKNRAAAVDKSQKEAPAIEKTDEKRETSRAGGNRLKVSVEQKGGGE